MDIGSVSRNIAADGGIKFENVTGLVEFRKVNFGSESILTLENYSEKGKIIFASFQSSNTSLLILMNLLRI